MSVKIYGEGINRIGVRQITPQIYWICHCIGKDAEKHNGGFAADFARINPNIDPTANDINYNSYLFMDEKTLLIDTLGPAQHNTILDVLSDLLGERQLDYLWISHTELPHAANATAIRRQYPDLQLMTVGGHDHYEIHGLEDALLLNYGDELQLGEHEIEIIKPIFLDHALTQWLYERKTGFMCPVDWALMAQNEHQSFLFMDEMEATGYSPERFMHDVSITNCVVFAWLRWADPDQIAEAIDAFYAKYDIRIFAASHTQVIRKDVPAYLAALREAMRRAVTADYNLVY